MVVKAAEGRSCGPWPFSEK